jgi:hypothetical protein
MEASKKPVVEITCAELEREFRPVSPDRQGLRDTMERNCRKFGADDAELARLSTL